MEQRNVLVVATTPLCKDGLTEMLIRIAEIIRKYDRVSFALGETAKPEVVRQLQAMGTVHELASRKKKLPVYLHQLSGIMRKEHFDYVHIHGNSPTMAADLMVAKSRRIPHRIAHCHNGAEQARWKQMTLKKLVNRFVTDPVACSRYAGSILYDQPFTVITNGIDCERFRFSEEKRISNRKKHGIPEDALVAGHIGRFTTQKNQGRLIHIFTEVVKAVPSAKLLLCGDGEDLEKCHALAKELRLQDQIVFAGEIENPEEYYAAMDVLVMPSLFEGLPLVGVEAQASGLPCVFSDTITEEARILEETAFLPLSASDREWAKAIVGLKAGDRVKAAERVKEAGFNRKETEKQILELYGVEEA